MSPSVLEVVQHYKKKIERNNNEEKIIHCFDKLMRLPMTLEILSDTGVGRTVNAFRHDRGLVGSRSRQLVSKWKRIFEESEARQQSSVNGASCTQAAQQGAAAVTDSDAEEAVMQIDESCVDAGDYNAVEPHESSTDVHAENGSRAETPTKSPSQHRTERRSSKHSRSRKTERNNSAASAVLRQEASEPSPNAADVECSDRLATSADAVEAGQDVVKPQESSSRRHRHHHQHQRRGEQRSDEDSRRRKRRTSTDQSGHPGTSSSARRETVHVHTEADEQRTSLTCDNRLGAADEHFSEQVIAGTSGGVQESRNHHAAERRKLSKSLDKKARRHPSSQHERKRPGEEERGGDGGLCNGSARGSSFSDILGDMDVSLMKKKKKKHKSSKRVHTDRSCVANTDTNTSSGSCMQYTPSSSQSTTAQYSPSPLEPEPEPPRHSVPSSSSSSSARRLAQLPEDLPTISGTYRPLVRPPIITNNTTTTAINNTANKRVLNEEEALAAVLAGKNKRTKVYSGAKSSGSSRVSSLIDICLRCLQENIDYLEYTGGVPYDILRPVLERCSAEQLHNIEYYNVYLCEDTAHLWKNFVTREFRACQREEMESWKELYLRCCEEREAKLNKLRSMIEGRRQDSLANSRKTKVAFEHTQAKPPRNVARKQARNGTASAVSTSLNAPSSVAPTSGQGGCRPPAGADPTARVGAARASTAPAKRKAPLMAKVLRSIGGRR